MNQTALRLLAWIWASTPPILKPVVAVLYCALLSLFIAGVRVLVSWLVGDRERIDWGLFTSMWGWGVVAALCFGLARTRLRLPQAWRPWALSLITSTVFWSCLALEIALRQSRDLTAKDLGIFSGAILVSGLAGGFVLWLSQRSGIA